ncbi:MAG: hypothetical protein Q7R99_01635 [bacterium]|nr:hypothetical protein [bacterium]
MLEEKKLQEFIVNEVEEAVKAGKVAHIVHGACSGCGRRAKPENNFCDCCGRTFVTVEEVKKRLGII